MDQGHSAFEKRHHIDRAQVVHDDDCITERPYSSNSFDPRGNLSSLRYNADIYRIDQKWPCDEAESDSQPCPQDTTHQKFENLWSITDNVDNTDPLQHDVWMGSNFNRENIGARDDQDDSRVLSGLAIEEAPRSCPCIVSVFSRNDLGNDPSISTLSSRSYHSRQRRLRMEYLIAERRRQIGDHNPVDLDESITDITDTTSDARGVTLGQSPYCKEMEHTTTNNHAVTHMINAVATPVLLDDVLSHQEEWSLTKERQSLPDWRAKGLAFLVVAAILGVVLLSMMKGSGNKDQLIMDDTTSHAMSPFVLEIGFDPSSSINSMTARTFITTIDTATTSHLTNSFHELMRDFKALELSVSADDQKKRYLTLQAEHRRLLFAGNIALFTSDGAASLGDSLSRAITEVLHLAFISPRVHGFLKPLDSDGLVVVSLTVLDEDENKIASSTFSLSRSPSLTSSPSTSIAPSPSKGNQLSMQPTFDLVTSELKPAPHESATAEPTDKFTSEPPPVLTLTATAKPTDKATSESTQVPTLSGTARPTDKPTSEPTSIPTQRTTDKPASEPTLIPTQGATTEPTGKRTSEPTPVLTQRATAEPTDRPTLVLNSIPTQIATAAPSHHPATVPTPQPSHEPVSEPTDEPTPATTPQPSHDTASEPIHEPTPGPTPQPIQAAIAKQTDKPSTKPTSQLTDSNTENAKDKLLTKTAKDKPTTKNTNDKPTTKKNEEQAHH